MTLTLQRHSFRRRRSLLVVIATLCYGASCLLFGLTPLFPVGCLAVLLCGAFDGVGVATRNTVVITTTPVGG